MPDPSRFVTIPSLDDPTSAPAGCSTLYVLEPVPNLNGKINWSTEAPQLRERLHTFLAAQGYPSQIITEQLITPLHWQAQGMAAGTPFALAHTFGQTGPSARRTSNGDCRECSSRAQERSPGSAFPWCSSPANLAANRVAAYLREAGG
jgi:phytoene desaturase